MILGGGHEVRCLDVRSGKLLWRAPLRGRLVAGRGCVAGKTVCVPVDRNQVFSFNLETGKGIGRCHTPDDRWNGNRGTNEHSGR